MKGLTYSTTILDWNQYCVAATTTFADELLRRPKINEKPIITSSGRISITKKVHQKIQRLFLKKNWCFILQLKETTGTRYRLCSPWYVTLLATIETTKTTFLFTHLEVTFGSCYIWSIPRPSCIQWIRHVIKAKSPLQTVRPLLTLCRLHHLWRVNFHQHMNLITRARGLFLEITSLT